MLIFHFGRHASNERVAQEETANAVVIVYICFCCWSKDHGKNKCNLDFGLMIQVHIIEEDPNDFMLSLGILDIHGCYIFIENIDQPRNVVFTTGVDMEKKKNMEGDIF